MTLVGLHEIAQGEAMTTTQQTPQEAFNEAANIAKGFFVMRPTDIDGFAEEFGYDLLNTGGGVMVAVKKVGDNHVIGVTDECVCLYEVDAGGADWTAVSLFFEAEDPWLVSDIYEAS